MMLRGLGDDSDDNDRNDKGRFFGLIAFDFPRWPAREEIGGIRVAHPVTMTFNFTTRPRRKLARLSLSLSLSKTLIRSKSWEQKGNFTWLQTRKS